MNFVHEWDLTQPLRKPVSSDRVLLTLIEALIRHQGIKVYHFKDKVYHFEDKVYHFTDEAF